LEPNQIRRIAPDNMDIEIAALVVPVIGAFAVVERAGDIEAHHAQCLHKHASASEPEEGLVRAMITHSYSCYAKTSNRLYLRLGHQPPSDPGRGRRWTAAGRGRLSGLESQGGAWARARRACRCPDAIFSASALHWWRPQPH